MIDAGRLLGGVPSLTRDDPAAFAPPPAFGPFRVLHQIGVGALGPVFRTYEPTRDRLIAVKVFRLDVTPEQAHALALELSKAAEAGLFHPSIVEPVAAGVEGTVAYRAEEYVAAESLDAAIRHYAPASLDKAIPFITQLAGAIDFARAAGVGHGALHLRDIFVTPEEARASGFGVVEALERQGLRAPVRRPYSAPERIAGQAWGTPADVFSLAAIAFELLTGRRPSGTGSRIGSVAGENLGAYGDMIQSVLARAMDDDPALRHPSALAFASALEAAARGERVTGAMEQVGAISGMAGPAATPLATPVPAASRQAPARAEEPPVVFDEEEREEAGAEEYDGAGVLARRGIDADPDVEEAAAALLFEPGPDEAFDDIASERELDEAHGLMAVDDERGDPGDSRERSLFDEDEAAEDLALDAPANGRFNSTVVPVRGGVHEPFDDSYVEDRDEMRAGSVAEPPRLAVLPLALVLILGLLVGFAAGYAIGGRAGTLVPGGEVASDAESQSGDPASADAGAQTPGAERTFSEELVTPPSPVPDAPPDAAAGAAPAAPQAASGRLIVRSTPSNANVTINGQWRGRTPLTLDDLPLGPYAVRVVQEGFEVAEEQVRLTAANAAGAVNVRLERTAPAAPPRPSAAAPRREPARPVSYTGSIYVDSRPRGARVLVDGKTVGVTPLRLPDVSIGSHVVRLELAGHRPWTSSTRVAAGQEARVTGSLEQVR